MAHEQITSNPFSDEALALAGEVRHWIARHKKLVAIGTTAVAIGMCSIGSSILNLLTTEYIPDIHESYLPNSLYIGSHSICRQDGQFPGGPLVMQDHGGVTVVVSTGGIQFYRHDPIDLFCERPIQ
ncbi:MAG: hypothetical protein AAB557_03405 [Patescibacteria group bacterium]